MSKQRSMLCLESSPHQRKSSCQVIQPQDGQIVTCQNPQSQGLKHNCTVEGSQEHTVALFRCDKGWSASNKSSSNTLRQVCLSQNWVKEFNNFSCKPNCGSALADENNTISKESDVSRMHSQFPWVISLFAKEIDPKTYKILANELKFICQGTLISHRAILTAATCVTLENTTVKRTEDLQVSIPTMQFQEMYEHKEYNINIEKIVLHPEYNVTTLLNNLAIIWLKKTVKFDDKINPICLPEVDDELLYAAAEGSIVSVTSAGTLQLDKIILETPVKCRRTIVSTYHSNSISNTVLCAKIEHLISHQQPHTHLPCPGNLGLSFAIRGTLTRKWTLGGILTGQIPQNNLHISNCNLPLLFTKIPPILEWINKKLGQESSIYISETMTHVESQRRLFSFSTTPSSYTSSNTHRTIFQTLEREPLTPEPFLVPYSHKQHSVEIETLYKHSTLSSVYLWNQGSMSHVTGNMQHSNNPTPFQGLIPTRFPISTATSKTTVKTTLRNSTKEILSSTTAVIDLQVEENIENNYNTKSFACPPLPPQLGVLQICRHDEYEDFDNCSNGGQIGTVAILECKNYYKPTYGSASVRRECLPGKRWSSLRTFACQLDCGISLRPRHPFIVNGIISDRVSWPWHATIWKNTGDKTQYICGATLISKSLLVTAAHCITESRTTRLVNKDELRVILGTKSSNYTINLLDSISKANLFYVKSIVVPDSYNGVTFTSDIGIIQLEYEVELSDYAKPICFPFQSKENSDIELLHLSPGTHGQTVGFGIDESRNLSTTIKETSLPVVSHRDCGEVLARFPSSSQFCAGYLNGTSVCNGDSGSGLFFSEGTGFTNRYIIQGVVSYGDQNSQYTTGSRICNSEKYAVYTKVSSFATWVQLQIETMEPEFQR